MNFIYSHGIPAFIVMILMTLIYWAIKLDKIQDYMYAIKKRKKLIMRYWSELQYKLFRYKNFKKDFKATNEIRQVNLQVQTTVKQILSQQKEINIRNSIKFYPSQGQLAELTRKNSIDYKIKINDTDQNQNLIKKAQNTQKQLLSHSKLKNSISTRMKIPPVSSSKLSNNRIQQNKEFLDEQKEEQERIQDDNYLKVNKNCQNKSKGNLNISVNGKSNLNIEPRQSIINLCQTNGIKTIRDLIKQGI